MRAEDHRQAALDHELTIQDLGDPVAKTYIRRDLIEAYWGATFQWIAYGCEQRHHQHRENHEGLARWLEGLGEARIADLWRTAERLRVIGWYGRQNDLDNIQRIQDVWQEVQVWATTPSEPPLAP